MGTMTGFVPGNHAYRHALLVLCTGVRSVHEQHAPTSCVSCCASSNYVSADSTFMAEVADVIVHNMVQHPSTMKSEDTRCALCMKPSWHVSAPSQS